MKIINYEYWIQYIIFESKLNDIFLEVSEQRAYFIFERIEQKLKRFQSEISLEEQQKLIKNELDKEINKFIREIRLNSQIRIKFTLNEYGNILPEVEQMDFTSTITLKTNGKQSLFSIIKNDVKFDGKINVNDFLKSYDPTSIGIILKSDYENILIRNNFDKEIYLTFSKKLSDFKEGKSKLGVDLEIDFMN